MTRSVRGGVLSRDPSVVAVFVVERQEGRRPRHRDARRLGRGQCHPSIDPNRLGAQLALAAFAASSQYTSTGSSFTFDTTVVPLTFDVLVAVNITLTVNGVQSSRVAFSIVKVSTVGNSIPSVVIIGPAALSLSTSPSVLLLDSSTELRMLDTHL